MRAKFIRGQDPKNSMDIGIYSIPSAKELIGNEDWVDSSNIEKYQRWIDFAMAPGKSKGFRKYVRFCVERGHITTSSSSVFQDWIDEEKPKIKEVEDALENLWPDSDSASKERLIYYAEKKLQESFQRGIDPKRSMDIGIRTWDNLSIGDILIAKKEIFVSMKGLFHPGDRGDTIWEDMVLLVTSVQRFLYKNKPMLRVEYYKNWTIQDAIKRRDNIEELFSKRMTGYYGQFERRFKILQRNESKIN